MSNGQGHGWANQYQQQGSGQQDPQGQWLPQYGHPRSAQQGQPGGPWQQQPYHPSAHQQRLGGPPVPYQGQVAPQGYGQPFPVQAYQQPARRYGLTAAQKFWYVLSNIPFGAGYFAKIPAKKALHDFGMTELTGPEAFWYILMCLPFGAGYFAKLPVAKALDGCRSSAASRHLSARIPARLPATRRRHLPRPPIVLCGGR